jgi:GxxExxY protein
MVIGLSYAGINVERQVSVPVMFRGRDVGRFRADLLCESNVLLELKSGRTIEPVHEAQLLHYLKAPEIEVGLLLNFGQRPQLRRLLFDNPRKHIRGNPCESVAGVAL